MTAADLAELELAYAPPFSSAKDPVNMIGFTIENVLTGKVKQFHWEDLDKLPRDGGVTILDVRTRDEYKDSAFVGSINIPLDELRGRMTRLDKSKPVYINCYSGLRSYIACRILAGYGFDCYNFSGGYGFYEYILYDKAFDEEARHGCGVKIK